MRAMAAAPEKLDNPLLTEFCGMQLSSPIVLLSGCVGFGEEYTRVEGFSNPLYTMLMGAVAWLVGIFGGNRKTVEHVEEVLTRIPGHRRS